MTPQRLYAEFAKAKRYSPSSMATWRGFSLRLIRQIGGDRNDQPATIKYCGHEVTELSEIPCRVSSDLHEWCNDMSAVSTRGSVKL